MPNNLIDGVRTLNKYPNLELIALTDKYAVNEGVNETQIEGVALFKASRVEASLPSVYNPCLCFIVQGHKRVMLNNTYYDYGPSQFLGVSVDIPMTNKITEATTENPYLLVKVDIDLQQLSKILLHIESPPPAAVKPGVGVFVGEVDARISDSLLRLLRMLDTPEEIPVLGKQTIREILYRVLCSRYGGYLSKITQKGSHTGRIAKAIKKIKESLNENITVEELAMVAGMSPSSFHSYFKMVTSMSPLQFKKTLRLIEARELMLGKGMEVSQAAYQVGYESKSQFNREYSRMFGRPPAKDIKTLRGMIA